MVIKRRKILEYRAFLEKSQWWPREKILEYQWSELKKLLEHATTQVPFWRGEFNRLELNSRDIKSPQDLIKLPLITKEHIRSRKQDMIADNYRGKTWTKATGGSTGTPLELDYTPESYDWRVAITKRGYGWAGCEDGVKQAYIWGIAIGDVPPLKKLKEDIHHNLLRQKYFNCFDFTEEKMAECLEALNRYRPKIIVGYTNPLFNFANFIGSSNKLNFRSHAVITAAEKMHEFQRAVLEEVFDCPAFHTYGSREFMLIASECEKHNGLHINAENLYVEIIKENGEPAHPGEMGHVVITDLHNYGMPFIRYKIGDMAIMSDKQCSCGRGLPLIDDIVGRSLDMIKTLDGRYVPGEFFPHLMKEFSGVERFQVIQNKIDQLDINIVKNESFGEKDFEFMKKEIMGVMGDGIELNFNFVNDIPLTRTGKYRVTISNLE